MRRGARSVLSVVRTGPGPNEAGLTLVEIVVTVAIMGLGVVAVLGLFQANIGFSLRHRAQADVQTVLVSSSDQLTNPDTALQPCNSGELAVRTAYDTVVKKAAPPGFEPSLISVRAPVLFWDPVTRAFEEITATNPCPADVRTAQLVTIEVLGSPQSQLVATIQVVKDDD